MSKKKLEEGGLLQQEDVNNSSTVSSVPYEYSYLKSEDTNLNVPAPQSIIDSTIRSVGFAEQSTRAGFGAEMPTLEARPDAYKTVFKSDFSNSLSNLSKTIKQFKLSSKLDRLAALNVNLAKIENNKMQVDALLQDGRIGKQQHALLSNRIENGEFMEDDSENDLMQIYGNLGVNEQDVARAEQLAKEYGLTNELMDAVYKSGNKTDYQSLLARKEELLQEVAEREDSLESDYNISEDWLLRGEISENRNDRTGANTGDYLRYQAAGDLAGTLSTAEGWLYSVVAPVVLNSIKAASPALSGNPYGRGAVALANIASVGYGIGLSRYLETSMEAGDIYWQRVDQLEKEAIQQKLDDGLPGELSKREKNDIAIEAYKGVEELKNKNYKLGVGDVLQFGLTFAKVPGMAKTFGSGSLREVGRAITSRNVGKIGTNLAGFGARVGLSRELEGAEEGLQFRWTQEYLAGDPALYNSNGKRSGFVSDYAEYAAVRAGIKDGDPALYNNLGFKHAVQSGKDMATMMTGSGRTIAGISKLYKYRQAIRSLKGGDAIDKDAYAGIENEVILEQYLKGNLENLKAGIYRMGSNPNIEGMTLDEAKESIKKIEKAEKLLDDIYGKGSPLSIALGGINIDLLPGESAIDPQRGLFGIGRDEAGTNAFDTNKRMAFLNAMEIVDKEQQLKDLEVEQLEFANGKESSLNSMFGLDDLSREEKADVQSKLESRGIRATPFDVQIEELKNELNRLKTDNKNIATGDFVYSNMGGYMSMQEFRRYADLQNRAKELGETKELTEAQRAELRDIRTELAKILYTSGVEYNNISKNYNESNIRRATMLQFIGQTIALMGKDPKKHLASILNSIAEKGMQLDQTTLETVMSEADRAIKERNDIQERKDENAALIEGILNGSKDISGNDKDFDPTAGGFTAFTPLSKTEQNSLEIYTKDETNLSPAQKNDLAQLRERAVTQDKINELQKQNNDFDSQLENLNGIADAGQKILNRGVESFLLDDNNFRVKSTDEVIVDTAINDLIGATNYLRAQLELNPDYADVNYVRSILEQIEGRSRIFERRAAETGNELFSDIAQTLEALYGEVVDLSQVVAENNASRVASQTEFENQITENLLNSIGIDSNFEFFKEGPFAQIAELTKSIIDPKEFNKIKEAVIGPDVKLTDKTMAAMLMVNLVKTRLQEDQVFKTKFQDTLKETKTSIKNKIKEDAKDSSIEYRSEYLDNPETTFDTYQLPNIDDAFDIVTQTSPTFRYEDHKNLSKYLEDVIASERPADVQLPSAAIPNLSIEKSDGVTRIQKEDLVKLLTNQLDLRKLTYLELILDSETTPIDVVHSEKFIADNPQTAPLKPTKQQLNAAREILLYLGLPEANTIPADANIGDFTAVLQGAAGTGKTKVVLQLAMTLSGLGTGSVFTMGHNASSSKTLSDALKTDNNTVENFLQIVNSEQGFPATTNLLIIDEAFGFSDEQMSDVNEAVVNINRERKQQELPLLKVIMLGDPGQITTERIDALQLNNISSRVKTFITPVSTVYRSDIPALVDFQNIFRRRLTPIENTPIVTKVTNLNIGTFNENTNPIKGVYGVSGNFKEGIKERLEKTKESNDGKRRVIITDPTRVEDYRAFVEGNGFNHVEVLSYIEAQGQTITEVYMDIKGLDMNGDEMSPSQINDALYTASSRASDLVVAGNLNIENTVDENLDKISSGLASEIRERDLEFLREVQDNYDFIKELPSLSVSDQAKEKTKELEENQEVDIEEQEDIADDTAVEEEINTNMDPIDDQGNEAQHPTPPVDEYYEEDTVEEVTDSEAISVDFPEFAATSETTNVVINGQTYTVAPAQDNQPAFAVVSKVGDKVGLVIYQPAFDIEGNTIPGAFRRLAVFGENDIAKATWIKPAEKAAIQDRINSGKAPLLTSAGIPGDKSIFIKDINLAANNALPGLIVPQGGIRRLTYKYKKRADVDSADKNTKYSNEEGVSIKRGVVDKLLTKFVTSFYNDSKQKPSEKDIKRKSSFKIFKTTREVQSYQSRIGEGFEIKKGVPYIIIEGIDNTQGNKTRIQMIPLVPRKLRRSNRDDFRNYYQPIEEFIKNVQEVERIIGHTYGTPEFRNFIYGMNMESLEQRMQEIGRLGVPQVEMERIDAMLGGVYAEVLRDETGALLRDENGRLAMTTSGPGLAQSVMNKLARANNKRPGFDGFRVVNKIKDNSGNIVKAGHKARGLMAVPDPQKHAGLEYLFYNIQKLQSLFTDVDGVNQVLYVPLILPKDNKKQSLSSKAVQQYIDMHLQDPTDEIYRTQVFLSRGEIVEQAPVETQEDIQADPVDDSLKLDESDLDDIVGDFKLFEDKDGYSDKKGKLVTKPEALKELRRILPDAFRKDGTLKTGYISFINGADLLRLTEKPGALGVFMDNMMFIKEDRGGIYKNIVRHETFHKIFSYFLTAAERKALLNAAREQYSEARDMNDLQVEEFLADKFMTYEQAPQSFTQKVAAFFKKVLRFFNIISKDANNVKKFFDNVENGYFTGFKGEPLDSDAKHFIDINKEYGNTDVYRASKHLLVRSLGSLLAKTDQTSTVDEAGNVSNVFFNRDERFAYVKDQVLPALKAKYANIKNPTEEQIVLRVALDKLTSGRTADRLYKELYNQKAAEFELESKEAESMQDQIIDASEINHKNNLSSEVRDFLNNITYTKADGTKETVSYNYAYFTALQLLSGLDSSLDTDAMLREIASREKELSHKPGSPGSTIIQAIKGLVETSLANEINITDSQGVLSSVAFPNNSKFDVTKNNQEVFVYHPTKDVSLIDVDNDVLDDSTKVIRRDKKESSASFVGRALRESGLEVETAKPMYKKFYNLNVFKNLYVNTASLRKERFHMGDYSIDTVADPVSGVTERQVKTRYYQHKEFGSKAANEANIKDRIFDNYKKLLKKRRAIDNLLRENKVELAYFTMLDAVGIYVPKDRVGFDKSNLDQVKTALSEVLGKVYAATNKRKKQVDEFGNPVVYKRNNKAKGEVKGQPVTVAATPEDALEDSAGFIKTLSSALINIDQNQKAGSIRTAEGKTVYTFHNSSFAIDSLLGLAGKGPVKDVHIENNDPIWSNLYKYNIFTNGTSKIIDIADHDAYADRKGRKSPTTMNLEKPSQWFERNFVYQFATAMQKESEGLSYIQQLHTVADTKNVRNVRVPVLSKNAVRKALAAIYTQSKAKEVTPLVFTEEFNNATSASSFAKAAEKKLGERIEKLSKFLTDNNIGSQYTALRSADAMLKEQDLGFKNANEAFIYNYAVNSFFANQVIMGDTSSLKDSFKVIKRAKVAHAPGYRGLVNDKYGMPKKYSIAISEDPKANPFEYMSNAEKQAFKDQLAIMGVEFDIADAQGYMLPSRRADIRKGFGNGLNIGNVLKPVYYGVHADGNAVAVKYSSVVLTDDLVNRFPALKDLRTKMERAKVGEFIMDTAIKNGNPKVQSKTGYNFETGETNFRIAKQSIIEMDSNNFRIQLDPEADIDTFVSNPTQLGYFINSNGKNKAESVEYYSLFAQLQRVGLDKVYRELGIKSNNREYSRGERQKLKNTIQKTLAKSAAKRENSLREAAMLAEGDIDVNFPAIVAKSISLLSSNFEKSVIKPKFPGQKLALMSDLGITVFEKGDLVGTRSELEAQGITVDDSWSERPLRHMYGNNNYAEVILPEALKGQFQIGDDFFNKYGMGFRIPSTELHSAIPLRVVGFSNEAGTSTLIAPKELSPLHGSDFDIDSLFIIRRATIFDRDKGGRRIFTAEGVDVRIDVQDALLNPSNYINNMEDVIDQAVAERSEVRNQSEINKDLDKRLTKEIAILNNVREAAIKNRMLEIYLDVITADKNRESMLTPINLKVLNGKDVNSVFDMYAKNARISVPSNAKNYKNSGFYEGKDLSDPFDEMYMHQSNQQGAKLTGIFANSMKAISYLMGDNLNDKDAREGASVITRDDNTQEAKKVTYKIDNKEYSDFQRIDTEGNAIFVALDGLVNAAIDNANEQILNILNLNNNTAGYMALMLAQGVPLNTAAAVIGQPAIRAAFEMEGSFDGNLGVIQDSLIDRLDMATEEVAAIIDAARDQGLNTTELENGISRFEDRVEEFDNYTKDQLTEQIVVIDFLKNLKSAQSQLIKVSNALSIIQAMPNDLASLEGKIEQWGELFQQNEDGTYSNIDRNLNSTILLKHPHIAQAFVALNFLSGAMSSVFHLASPRVAAYADSFSGDINRSDLENKNQVQVEFRSQILRYLTSSLEDTSNEKSVTIKTDSGSFKLRGNRAFVHNATIRVKEMQDATNNSGDRLGDVHPFLSNILTEKDRFGNKYIKAADTKAPTQDEMIDIHNSFNKLDQEDQDMLVKYAIVNEGLEFAPGNITLLLPPNVLTDVSKKRETMLSRLFATGESLQKQSSLDILDNVKDHFELQYNLNNPTRVRDHYRLGKDESDNFIKALTRNNSIYGTTIENGIVTDYAVPGGGHAQYLMNNNIGVLYTKVHEVADIDGNVTKTLYQQVGRASSQVSAFTVPNDILEAKTTYTYNKKDYFNPQYVTRTVDVLSQKDLTLSKPILDQDGNQALKPGDKMIVKLAGDSLRTNAKIRTIESISNDGLSIKFKGTVTSIKSTPKQEQDAMKANMDNDSVQLSDKCKTG